jgi:uncharacterized Zn-finger protein
VLIEPSLDDPCAALCIIDRAPKPRAADGKLSDVHNEVGVPIVRIGCREFKCIGDIPPQGHPHIYLKMGYASEIVCPYCSTLFRFDPSLGGATLGQTYTQLHCARFQSARDRTCRAYREDRSTLPIENQSFVSSGDGVFIPAFSFPGFDSIPGVILAKHRPKFPTALRGLLAKPLLKQDR